MHFLKVYFARMKVLLSKERYSDEEAAEIFLNTISNDLETASDRDEVVSDIPGVLGRALITDNTKVETGN